MPTLDCTTRREDGDGVTLVACRLSNDRDVPCRVRVEPAVDRIAPPRRRGLPAPGWTDGRYETVVAAGTTVGVGFATPDRPSDPPASLTVLEEDADPTDGEGLEPTPTGAARSLLDPRPPRGAVSAGASRSGTPDGERDEPTDGDPTVGADTTESRDGTTVAPERTRGGDGSERADGGPVPPAVAAWIARAERREDRVGLRALAGEVAAARRRIGAGEPEP